MHRKSKLMPTHDCLPVAEGICVRKSWCENEPALNVQSIETADRGVIYVNGSQCKREINCGDRVRLTFHTAPGRAGWWEATKIED